MTMPRNDLTPQRTYCARLERGIRVIAGTVVDKGRRRREENELAGARVLDVLEKPVED
jgi:hypothetical protein